MTPLPKRIPTKVRVACEKIGVDPRDPEVYRAVLCGLHSGFPICCIAFWVRFEWAWSSMLEGPMCGETNEDRIAGMTPLQRAGWAQIMAHRDWSKARNLADGHGQRDGYVRCPACVVNGHYARVRRCGCYGRRRWSKRGNQIVPAAWLAGLKVGDPLKCGCR